MYFFTMTSWCYWTTTILLVYLVSNSEQGDPVSSSGIKKSPLTKNRPWSNKGGFNRFYRHPSAKNIDGKWVWTQAAPNWGKGKKAYTKFTPIHPVHRRVTGNMGWYRPTKNKIGNHRFTTL